MFPVAVDVANRVFGNLRNLLYLVFPSSVTSISGGLAFTYNVECPLQTYGIVENNIYYSDNNFIIRKSDHYLVSAPTNCIISSDAVGIASEAIYYNYQRTTITIPGNITYIANYGLRYMHGLTTVYIDNPTISLANSAFLCGQIDTVYYNGTVAQYNNKGQTWIRGMFNNSDNISVSIYCTDSDDPIVLS